MNEEEAIEYLKNYKYDNEVKESIEIVLNLLEKKNKEIEYYQKQKIYDDQFKHELLEEIRCKSLTIDSLNKILDDRLICIQGGRGLYAKLKGLDKEYLIREYLSMYKMCKQELEKKDKIIDETARTLSEIMTDIPTIKKQFERLYCDFINSNEDCCWKTDKTCTDCIKKYFENKVTDTNVGERKVENGN